MQARIEELKAGFDADREELERLAGEGMEKEKSTRRPARGDGPHAKWRTEGGMK